MATDSVVWRAVAGSPRALRARALIGGCKFAAGRTLGERTGLRARRDRVEPVVPSKTVRRQRPPRAAVLASEGIVPFGARARWNRARTASRFWPRPGVGGDPAQRGFRRAASARRSQPRAGPRRRGCAVSPAGGWDIAQPALDVRRDDRGRGSNCTARRRASPAC